MPDEETKRTFQAIPNQLTAIIALLEIITEVSGGSEKVANEVRKILSDQNYLLAPEARQIFNLFLSRLQRGRRSPSMH